jgi:hypothetical protein
MQNPVLKSAKYWLSLGFAPIPLQIKQKKAKVSWREYQSQLPSEDDLKLWFTHDLHNLALVTGHAGLTVLDFDTGAAFDGWKHWAREAGGLASVAAKMAYKVRTARGAHVYLRVTETPRTMPLRSSDGQRIEVDIKALGGYVVAPPSVHPSGAKYEIMQMGILLRVGSLSEVLPASMLVQADPGDGMKAPVHTERVEAWQKANASAWGKANYADRATVERVRAAYKIEDFFSDAGMQSSSKHLMFRCPFHQDDHPSFWVDTRQQLCNCFVCSFQKPMDVINFYGRLHGLSNVEAITTMAEGL